MKIGQLKKISQLVRYYSLLMTTKAGSGHPTSSLSAADLMVGLMFGGSFKYDVSNPQAINNDRLIFSKGHASPLFYSLWLAAGKLTEKEILTYRQFGSQLEGHPTVRFPYTVAATGSLGQGLSIGVGLALNAKYLDDLSYQTYVLLGDSEMAEGSNWEAVELASHYKLNNLTAIVDVNRLGQSGETMDGYHLKVYADKFKSFGWEPIIINGHNFRKILKALRKKTSQPKVIIAKTVKGKGVKFLENKNGWHGRVLNQEELARALKELGRVDLAVRGVIAKPTKKVLKKQPSKKKAQPKFSLGSQVATREAYGVGLAWLAAQNQKIVALDGETSNSTHAADFAKAYPRRYFEMYIAEQNMVGTALGLSKADKIPFVSTFSAFFTRAFDQIRMAQYSNANIKFVGSHAGVSIGQDGPSQMGLEEIAMFRTILNSVVLYPSDAVSTVKLLEQAAKYQGLVYLQTTRMKTPVIYQASESFKIGGSKTVKSSSQDVVTVIGAGITLHEALKAYEILQPENINIRVIDLYSVKPIDAAIIKKAALETKAFVTVEDHHHEGGLGEAVLYCLAELAKVQMPVEILAVRKMPRSGSPEKLLNYEDISASAIVKAVKKLL
ncbi:MAG: transketolase [Candidatus Buchananbacteria bacterium]|nr:transketolase [Candidatus Buchananbacteria bacterium]